MGGMRRVPGEVEPVARHVQTAVIFGHAAPPNLVKSSSTVECSVPSGQRSPATFEVVPTERGEDGNRRDPTRRRTGRAPRQPIAVSAAPPPAAADGPGGRTGHAADLAPTERPARPRLRPRLPLDRRVHGGRLGAPGRVQDRAVHGPRRDRRHRPRDHRPGQRADQRPGRRGDRRPGAARGAPARCAQAARRHDRAGRPGRHRQAAPGRPRRPADAGRARQRRCRSPTRR